MAGTAPAVFNAANERAVSEFLDGKIKFTMIVELIQECLSKHTVKPSVCLDELLKADEWAREFVHDQIVQFDSC
jgi:1-deoxy-D-xylulose-5-phosphate reductoisomerase